ncbi:MAG TPA: hypothetical protein DDW52_14990 [Planctomycetaceae bacterium]|nr:hypothetical protein [Planctomycetaceae bacterium]
MQASIQVLNEKAVIGQLRSIERKVQRKVVRKATNAAGREVLKTTKRNAQAVKQTGYTARSLKSVTRSRKGYTNVRIGQAKRKQFKARKSLRARGRNLSQVQRAGKPVPIHWLERGTKPHFIQAAPGKRLVFVVGRRTKYRRGLAFAKRVLVPGMRAQGILRKSARQSRRRAAAIFVSVAASEMKSA